MASSIVRLRLLLSSPGNLQKDREIVKTVVDQINLDLGSRHGYHVEVVDWQTHTWPAAGTHPQETINQQFPTDIDIYLGLMGSYFGTPTRKWGSGTEEEFRLAFDSWQKNQKPQIMFYFSDSAINLGDIDPSQLSKCNEFRNEVGALGVRYEKYADAVTFQINLRRHMVWAIEDILQSDSKAPKEIAAPEQSLDILANFSKLIADDALVAVDELSIQAADHMNSHTACMTRLTKPVTQLAKKLQSASKNIEQCIAKGDEKGIERSFAEILIAMQKYQKALYTEIPSMEFHFTQALTNLVRASEIVEKERLQEIVPIDVACAPLPLLQTAYLDLKSIVVKFNESFEKQTLGNGDIDIQRKRIFALHADLINYLDRAINLIRSVPEAFPADQH